MMRFLKAIGGFAVGALLGTVIAFVSVFFVWPKLVGGIDWDALGPGGAVIFFRWALILGFIGGVLGAFSASRLDRKSSSAIDSLFTGFFFLSIGFVVAAFGAYTGISACYRFFTKS